MTSAHRTGAALFLGGVVAVFAAGAQTGKLPEPQAAGHWHDISMQDYQQHLTALEKLVDTCAKARDTKACDPAAVGADDRITITVGGKTEQRVIRYAWLRSLFLAAQAPDEKATQPAAIKETNKRQQIIKTDQHATSQLLKDAKARLKSDLAQAHAPLPSLPSYAREHAVMRDVLAEKEFRNLQQTSVTNSILEKLGNWLNRFLASVANLRSRSAWVGRAIVWGFILGVCIALGYSLLRLERRWRVRLTPEDNGSPAPGAASARDWQLWLKDARSAAAAGQWREAIHFVYWAAISRLESRRLWPADRARTPREYLALVAQEDPRRAGLSDLTGTFERFWYGGRAAVESDYRAAERVATTLIGGGSVAENAAHEGGGR